MFFFSEIRKSWEIIWNPKEFYIKEKDSKSYIPLIKYYLEILIILTILTPIMNFLGFPSNIIHGGTNAQMGAYLYAPSFEAVTGITRYFWVAVITYLGNAFKLPILGILFHLFGKIMGGKGTLIQSFKIAVYSAAPVLLFGWIPYFALISGIWPGYLYVIGFNELHETKIGKSIAFINFMIGIQIVYAFAFGWVI